MRALPLRRRTFLQSAGGCAALIAAPNIARAQTGLLAFSVWREGSEIGTHRLAFTTTATETVVDIDIDLVVKLMFIPVYGYAHTNQERWQAGQLAGFASQTDDNGDLFQVDAKANGPEILAETLGERFVHPLDRRPSTYWHKNFLTQTTWIDTQKGSSVECALVSQDTQIIELMGEMVETEHFELTGDLNLNLWYRGNDWVKLTFTGEDGSIIEYRLQEFQPIDMQFA